jgi:hypothetical protein
METVRTMLAIVAQNRWCVYQMVVNSTFFNGHLEEEVYVQQPQGYEIPGQENKAYRLKKALYWLKKDPRAWDIRIDSYLTQNGFQRSDCDPTLYIKANHQVHQSKDGIFISQSKYAHKNMINFKAAPTLVIT